MCVCVDRKKKWIRNKARFTAWCWCHIVHTNFASFSSFQLRKCIMVAVNDHSTANQCKDERKYRKFVNRVDADAANDKAQRQQGTFDRRDFVRLRWHRMSSHPLPPIHWMNKNIKLKCFLMPRATADFCLFVVIRLMHTRISATSHVWHTRICLFWCPGPRCTRKRTTVVKKSELQAKEERRKTKSDKQFYKIEILSLTGEHVFCLCTLSAHSLHCWIFTYKMHLSSGLRTSNPTSTLFTWFLGAHVIAVAEQKRRPHELYTSLNGKNVFLGAQCPVQRTQAQSDGRYKWEWNCNLSICCHSIHLDAFFHVIC